MRPLTEKQRSAWRLRNAGLSYAGIGREMGTSTSAAQYCCHVAFEKVAAVSGRARAREWRRFLAWYFGQVRR